ncbi:alpha/beta fold hydrolase [Flavobacteriaceae bacterium AU392]|nr:alpha/beta hydrolase [Flavobacteriaceae bacterium]RKM85003.1 alpha/beta fold hydrolase [Flavobacteriaceae bacterium AU392]
MTSNFILFKNTKIHFTVNGEGQAIVLLHGFLENSTMWNASIPQLSKNHKVICIDLLGHGNTGCIGYIHTMELMAEGISQVLNFLKISNLIFIGHSMGGYVALAYAEKYPKTIKGICLVNSTSKSDSEERKLNRDRAIKAVKHNHKAFINMAISNLFMPENRNRFSYEINQLKNEALKTPLQGIIAALEGMKIRGNREYVIKTSSFKKMMMISKKDPVLDYSSLLDEAQKNGVQTVELSDGHMSYIENKKSFSYYLMHFIENI